MVRSLLPLATCAPLGDQSTAKTSSWWPDKVSRAVANLRLPEALFFSSGGAWSSAACHTLSVESREAEMSRRESGDHATAYAAATWPVNVARKTPVRPCHNFTFLSNDADANFRASGENAMQFTGCWWPVNLAGLDETSKGAAQSIKVASSEPETRRSPPDNKIKASNLCFAASLAAAQPALSEPSSPGVLNAAAPDLWSKGPVRKTCDEDSASVFTRWACPVSVRARRYCRASSVPSADGSHRQTFMVRSRDAL
mmetsp:Transcript_6780/g.21888  ORF Transcript_6780/g.21888 Transcript_6780/m.21888 type:complete len:255 (-) Transcript_6780:882-1646(-)